MRVAAFTRYGRHAASTRQRLLQYLPDFAAAGIEVDYHPLLEDDYVRSLATGTPFSKGRIARSYLRRVRQLLAAANYDLIWIYAEAFPYLPGIFEQLAFQNGTPVIYDFDDAFFHQYDDSSNPAARLLLRDKLAPLIRGAAACCCGNEYLRDYAARFSPNSIILPTVVDTEQYRPAARPASDIPVIGWIGSPSTWGYMRPLLPLLEEFRAKGAAQIRIVGAGKAAHDDAQRYPALTFREWSEQAEIAEVQSMDIGIMPLPDEQWARGKSGYKLVQYLACGLPVVASPIGVNSQIVRDGSNGYLAKDAAAWRAALMQLLASADLRIELGAAGRQDVVARYSRAAHAPRLVRIFKSVAARQPMDPNI